MNWLLYKANYIIIINVVVAAVIIGIKGDSIIKSLFLSHMLIVNTEAYIPLIYAFPTSTP